ncbi:MAG: hypothetical protein C4B59_12255 [Candidatus Methanogaster sp.]|uniref:Uncharacterized protein n=1 Tax=Candidatus Methanogaster sp. TaxID=3386292 RepID=A0AC61L0Q6_9EURY|nr:MAG: hypothetical protein C4B59_12255 [ANME-2 cluster archaeon]
MAILGGFALYAIIFMFNDPPSSLKIKTSFQKGSFVIISALGGLAILRPEDALAAFPAGLIGWYLVLRHIEGHKQEFKDLSVGSITRDEISESVYGLNEIKESYENGRR